MNAWAELIERCAVRRRQKLGNLSDEGFEELRLAVREDPASFVDAPEERAFLALAQGLDAYGARLHDDDLLDDDAFRAERARRLEALRRACDRALDLGPCLDARLVRLIARDLDPDALLEGLLEIERDAAGGAGGALGNGSDDLWNDVFSRPRLRLRAAVARTCLDGARVRMAASAAESALEASPADAVGARHTYALALARLEDEAGLDRLDERFRQQGDAWSRLARAILLFKLDRLPAARRALRGYAELCEGGAYALLRPTFVEIYLPDRPEARPGSFEECLFAVREAEPVIADAPDFISWCQDFDWLAGSARDFAEDRGMDW